MNMEKTNRRNQNILKTLSNSQWFLDQCEEIRKKYLKSEKDEALLSHEIKSLGKNLSATWENSLKTFIRSGVLDPPTIGAQIIFNKNWDTGEQELSIRVFKHTTKEDIQKIWKQVKLFQKWLQEIWAPGFSDDNKLILDIWQEVASREKKPRSITREVSALLFSRHNKTFDESDIRKRVSDLKKQLAVQKPMKKNRQ